jgi:hypothetical protein
MNNVVGDGLAVDQQRGTPTDTADLTGAPGWMCRCTTRITGGVARASLTNSTAKMRERMSII